MTLKQCAPARPFIARRRAIPAASVAVESSSFPNHRHPMDRATSLLHAFYNPSGLQASERQQIHAELVQLIRNPGTADDAARYITAAVGADHTTQLDAVPLHYALHALEERARSAAFGELSGDAVRNTVSLLISLVVSAYRRNTSPKSVHVPQHVLMKAARTAASFGRREWAAAGNSNAHFPRAVLQLVDRDGGATPRLPELLAGITLLTVLVDDALDDPRAHMLAAESQAVRKNLKVVVPDILAALEVGLRIKGPGLSDNVPVAAARSIASIARVHPPVAPEAAALLRRCVLGIDDRVTTEMLGVLADLFGEANAPLGEKDCHDAMIHVAGLLEAVAMEEIATATEDEDVVYKFKFRLVAYAEAVVKRIIGLGISVHVLERLFNGLMGTTLLWAEFHTSQFPFALDAWISIFETMVDCEVDTSGKLVQNVLQALSQLCVTRCMRDTNHPVLNDLHQRRITILDDEKQVKTDLMLPQTNEITTDLLKTLHSWDYTAQVVDNLASDYTGVSTALVALCLRGEEPDGLGDDIDGLNDTLHYVTETHYIGKCIEALVAAAQVSPQQVGGPAADFAVKVMLKSPILERDWRHFEDIETATNLANSLTQVLPPTSAPIQQIFQAVITQLRVYPERISDYSVDVLFVVLRLAASCIHLVSMPDGEPVDPGKKLNAEILSHAAARAMEMEWEPKLNTAAAHLLLLLGQHCGHVIYSYEAPYVCCFSAHNRRIRPVCALGALGFVQWTLLKRGARNKKWTEEECNVRRERFSGACVTMFGDFVQYCRELRTSLTGARLVEIARGAALLRTVVSAVLEQPPQVKEILWTGAGREISACCLQALCDMRDSLTNGSHNVTVRNALFATMGSLVGTMRKMLSVCRRQVRRDAPSLGTDIIQLCLDATGGGGAASTRLSRALLQLLLDHVVCEGPGDDGDAHMRLISASVDVATRSIADGSDSNLGCTAVSVLTEVMSRYWLTFWPGDAVRRALPRSMAGNNMNGAPGTGEGHNVFFAALRGLLSAVRSADYETSRAALLALETLNASRRLYARDPSFRACGAAQETLVATMQLLGASGDTSRISLSDEADSVVWGIASVDFDAFYKNGLPKVVTVIAQCSPDDVRRLCAGIYGINDRPSFVKALHALVNDLAFFDSRRKAPVL